MIKTIDYKESKYNYEHNNGAHIFTNVSNNEKFELNDNEYRYFIDYNNKTEYDKTRSYKLVSFYNEMIRFNPFQFKPYFRLTNQGNKENCVYIADEVGAGKTFETGILISEMLYSKEISMNDNILIVCPNMLCNKWQEVLHTCFGIISKRVKSMNDVHGICVMSFDSISLCKEPLDKQSLKLIIIDEAHNASGKRFDKILATRKKSEYAVMISATPLSGEKNNEEIQKNCFLEKMKLLICLVFLKKVFI